MHLYEECFPCLARHLASVAELAVADPGLRKEVIAAGLRALERVEHNQSAPEAASALYRVMEQAGADSDPYRLLKEQYNRFSMDLIAHNRERWLAMGEPFAIALCLSMAANVIDFGKYADLSEAMVTDTLERALEQMPEQALVEKIRRRIEQSGTVLVLGDNAGEIAFDRLLIEQMPVEPRRITYAVRGFPALNDATERDARQVGMDSLVRVIPNGSAVPGTVLETCSAEFREVFDRADLILAKGQGNYETLYRYADSRVINLLQVKCPVVSRLTGVAVGKWHVGGVN